MDSLPLEPPAAWVLECGCDVRLRAIFSAVTAASGRLLPWLASSGRHSPLHFASVRHTLRPEAKCPDTIRPEGIYRVVRRPDNICDDIRHS